MELKLGSQRDHCHALLTAVLLITSKRHRQIKWKRKYNIYNVEKENMVQYNIYIYIQCTTYTKYINTM